MRRGEPRNRQVSETMMPRTAAWQAGRCMRAFDSSETSFFLLCMVFPLDSLGWGGGTLRFPWQFSKQFWKCHLNPWNGTNSSSLYMSNLLAHTPSQIWWGYFSICLPDMRPSTAECWNPKYTPEPHSPLESLYTPGT